MKLKDADFAKNLKKFDENIFIEELMDSVEGFSEQMQLMVNEALKHAVNKTDFFHIYEWLLEPVKWKMPKVSLDTFLNDDHYLGSKTRQGKGIYPEVRKICREVIEGAYVQAIELAGIGSGKSFSSQIMACYQAHHLLCLRDPHETYKVVADKPITIMNMGVTSTQALEVVFSGIKAFIYGSDGHDGSPFFMQFNPTIQQTAIRFKREKVLLSSGNSKATTPLGFNVFCAILDEAAFYLDNDDQSVAKDIFDSLQARIISRFGKGVGLIMAISSPRYEGDFITEMIAKSRELGPYGKKKYPGIYSIQLPTWKAKSKESLDMENRFYFDIRRGEIMNGVTKTQLKNEERNVNYIESGPITSDYDVREIPGDFLVSFQQNPEKAKRDFGATPSTSIAGFFSNPKKVSEMFNMETKNPVIKPGQYKFAGRPQRVPYFIHLDIGFNRDGKGDHTGFCMGHFGGWILDETVNEYRMKFVIDLTERIGITEETGEVDLAEVRQRIYTLKDMGYAIKLVTFDRFACLTADTKVYTLDRELVNITEIKDGDWILGSNTDGSIKPVQAKACRKTGVDKPIYKVMLDNGEIVKATDNHLFMLRDGTYKPCIELQPGDSLMPFYNKISNKNDHGLDGYRMVKDNKTGKWFFVHQRVAKDIHNYKKTKGFNIHHKNFNKLDNSPDNLEVMTAVDHLTLHNRLAGTPEKMAMMRSKTTPEGKIRRDKALSETGKRNWKNKKFRKTHPITMQKARWATQKQIDKHIALHKEIQKGNKNGYKKEFTFLCILNNLDLNSYELAIKFKVSRTTILARCKENGYTGLKEVRAKYNHKVVSVEYCGAEDVYDIEVPETHNFAIGAGIFVHNSKDFRQIIEKKGFRTDYVSVDKDTGPYDILKAAAYEDRIDIPYDPIVERELKQLELIKGSKVDHPPSGCFTGDTRIALTNGQEITFEDAFKLYGKGEFSVYGNLNGKILHTTAKNCRITKYTENLVEIRLSGAKIIQCTPEHRVLLKSGVYKEAQNLNNNDILMQTNGVYIEIENIKKIQQDCAVWDIETNTSNFALANGVFVHNSKDVGDALAGVCWNIAEHTPKSSISVQNIVASDEKDNKALGQYRALKEKEKYYERVRRQVQKQMEMDQRVELIQRNIEDKNRNNILL